MNSSEDRPIIPSAEIFQSTKDIEAFQNKVLRPVIKHLHGLLMKHFSCLLFTKKGDYFKISTEKKANYIHSIFQTEVRYKSELKGMIIGKFTVQEFEEYTSNSKIFDKRIYSIVEERILTSQSELQDLRK